MNKRRLNGIIILPLILIVMISALFFKNYFGSNYTEILDSIYINSGNSILVAVKPADTNTKKIKFFELNASNNEVINSFSVNVNTTSELDLRYDNNAALITVINDSSKNSAISVYNVYKYQSGEKTPSLISSDMQSDTSMRNVFYYKGALAIIDEDTSGQMSAVYIKNGVVVKQQFSDNKDITNNIKRFANEEKFSGKEEIPYAVYNLYDGRTAYIGMFLNDKNEFPIVIGDKDTALNQFASILYKNTKLIKLFSMNPGQRVGIYSYGKESAKTLLEPTAAFYNAYTYYPDINTTIVLADKEDKTNSALVGYIYDNTTGKITKDITETLKKAAGLELNANDDIYLSSDALCIVGAKNFYSINTNTLTANTSTQSFILQYINKYDKYNFDTFYDYAVSEQGSTLLYSLALWTLAPILLLVFSFVGRMQRKDVAKRSKLVSGKITAINPTNMRMYGMMYSEFEVEAYVGGAQKKFNIRSAVPPGQIPMIGQSVVVLFDPLTGKATFPDEKMVNEALGKPAVKEVVIDSIEDMNINVSDTDIVKLNVTVTDEKGKIYLKVPAIQTSVMPYNPGEKISIRYMSNSMEDTVTVAGRGKNTSQTRAIYSGQAEIITARSIGSEIDGRYIVDINAKCKAKIGSVYFDNILLTKDVNVLLPGVNIAFSADKELFEKRLKLQNMERDTAVVEEIEATGDAVGYSPVLDIKLKLTKDVSDITLYAYENVNPLDIPKVGDKVLIGFDPNTKEATIIKRF